MSKIPKDLDSNLNKRIDHLCKFSLGNNHGTNHCAHFVSHVMGYEFSGVTCKNLTSADKKSEQPGATIRVDDIFKRSMETGLLSDKAASMIECLIFVTLASNVSCNNGNFVMGNHPRKHIGILSKGKVWNYSNSSNKVVADTIEAFKVKYTNAYKSKGTTVEFYYGKFI